MPAATWAIITGEYPDMPGGVADYARLVAAGLARRGERVHVFTSARCVRPSADAGVIVHRLADHFAAAGVKQLMEEVSNLPPHTRILLQYVPHAFGAKAMNLWFCAAVMRLAEKFALDVMFHEVAMPIGRRASLKSNLIGLANRAMARMLAQNAQRLFVSTEAWTPMLRRLARRRQPIIWAPIPSNIAPVSDPSAVEAARRRLGARCVGHFGSCHESIRKIMPVCIEQILASDNSVTFAFIGAGSSRAGEEIRRRLPGRGDRIITTGMLSAEEVAAAIAACEVMLIPFVDGITTRRTSAMASLACGVPLVTTDGALTEPLWREHQIVRAVPVDTAESLAKEVVALLASPQTRQSLAGAARAFYQRNFAINCTLRLLQQPVAVLGV